MEELSYNETAMNEEFISASEYESATRTVVRTLGGDHKIDIVFAGSEAKISAKEKSSKIVTLPANDPKAKMTKRQYHIAQGFANHESMHSLCTDIDGLISEIKKLTDHKQKLTLAMYNGIEDVRIEHVAKKLYPGMPRKIDATVEFAGQHFLNRSKDDQDKLVGDFKKIGPLAITWAGRKALGYNAPSLDKCLALLDPSVRKMVEEAVEEVMKLETGAMGIGNLDRKLSFKGSHEALELAKKLSKEPPKKPDPKKDEEEQQVAGTGSGSGKGGKGQDEASRGHGACTDSEFIPQDDAENPDFLVHVGKELNTTRTGKYRPLTTSLDVLVRAKDKTNVAQKLFQNPDNHRDYTRTLEKMTGKLAVMRRKLERALHAKMAREYTSGHRTGQIDVRGKGVAILKGRENVFRKREDGKDINSAVTILVDASGSMEGSKIRLAQQACIALGEAIARVGVPLEILVFNTRMPSSDEIANFDDIYQDYLSRSHESSSRSCPISIYEVKQFEDTMNLARRGMGAINKMVSSANADSESVLKAWDRLKVRPEKNKILLVLSDGEPAGGGSSGHQETHLRDVVELIGIEGGSCVGIGIQSEAVKRFYPRYQVVREIDELAGSVLDNIARLLLGERFKVDNSRLLDSNKEQ